MPCPARSVSQHASGSQGTSPMSFLPAPEFLRTFNPVLESSSGLPAVVSSSSAPICSASLAVPYNPHASPSLAKIIAGQFVNLTDLLSDNNSQADDHEPQLSDLVGWIEAFIR